MPSGGNFFALVLGLLIAASVVSAVITGKITVGRRWFSPDVADRRREPIMWGLGIFVRIVVLGMLFYVDRVS